MQAGRLDERVTIQSVTTEQNAYGEPVPTWADAATVWADVTPARGSERFVSAGDQEQAVLSHVVTIRYRSGLSPVTNRLVWREKVLDLESVQDPNGRMAMLRLLCREVVEAGEVTVFDVSQGRWPALPPMIRLWAA